MGGSSSSVMPFPAASKIHVKASRARAKISAKPSPFTSKISSKYAGPVVVNVGKRSFFIARADSAHDRDAAAAFLYDVYVKESKWTYFGKDNPAGLRISTKGLNRTHDTPSQTHGNGSMSSSQGQIRAPQNYLWDSDSFTSCPGCHTFLIRDVETSRIVGTVRLTERYPRHDSKLPTELYSLSPSVQSVVDTVDVEISRVAVHKAYRGSAVLPIIYRYIGQLCERAGLTMFGTVKKHNAMANIQKMSQLAPQFYARDSAGNPLTFKYEPQDPNEVEVLVITGALIRATCADFAAVLRSRKTGPDARAKS